MNISFYKTNYYKENRMILKKFDYEVPSLEVDVFSLVMNVPMAFIREGAFAGCIRSWPKVDIVNWPVWEVKNSLPSYVLLE